MKCFPHVSLRKVLECLVLRSRRICNTDSKFKIRSNGYQQYLIGRGYKSHNMSKQFSELAKMSRETALQVRVKIDFKVTLFLTEFNPVLPDLNKLIKNRLPLLFNQLK